MFFSASDKTVTWSSGLNFKFNRGMVQLIVADNKILVLIFNFVLNGLL